MYEARHAAFHYTIERRISCDGSLSWQWQVKRAGELIGSGASPRSHADAETSAMSFIFLIEAGERYRPLRLRTAQAAAV